MDAIGSQARLSIPNQSSGSGRPLARSHSSSFTFRCSGPTSVAATTRAKATNDTRSETPPPLLESVFGVSLSSSAGTIESSTGAQFTTQPHHASAPSSRRRSINTLAPEEGSRSRYLTLEPSTRANSRRAKSVGAQASSTARSVEGPDYQNLETIFPESSSRNSLSGYTPDTNRSNADNTSTKHREAREPEREEKSRSHSAEGSSRTKEGQTKEPKVKKEKLQESRSSTSNVATPKDTKSSAKSSVKDESKQYDGPSIHISPSEDLGSILVTETVLDVIKGLFVGFDPLARYKERNNRCIANTVKGIRCTRRIQDIDASLMRWLSTQLSAPYDPISFGSEVLPIVNIVLCGRSHREIVRKFTENMKRGAGEANENITVAPAACATKEQNQVPPKTPKTRPVPPRYNLRHSPRTPIKLPQFIRWQPSKHQNLPLPTAIAETMRKPLTRTDEKSGWLYVYWNKSNFGYRKIGYTTVKTAARLRQWELQCQHSAEHISHKSETLEEEETKDAEEEEAKIPHVRRLEALMHVTLKQYRRCETYCPGCRKRHKEWFHVPDRKLQIVRSFWTEWIRREPYEYIEAVGAWMLKAAFEADVEAIARRLVVEEEDEERVVRVRMLGSRWNGWRRSGGW